MLKRHLPVRRCDRNVFEPGLLLLHVRVRRADHALGLGQRALGDAEVAVKTRSVKVGDGQANEGVNRLWDGCQWWPFGCLVFWLFGCCCGGGCGAVACVVVVGGVGVGVGVTCSCWQQASPRRS